MREGTGGREEELKGAVSVVVYMPERGERGGGRERRDGGEEGMEGGREPRVMKGIE